MSKRELFLHEELMLLALKDRKGTVVSNTMYPQALGGAILAELMISERIGLEKKGKKKRLVVSRDPSPVEDPLLEEWRVAIAEREKPRAPEDWVQRMAQTKRLKHRVATGLVKKGILRDEEDRILGIFKRTIYPELDPGPERDVVARIESAVLREEEEVAPRTAVLVALAHRTGLLATVLDKERLKKRKDRIEEIAEGNVAGDAAKAAMEAMQAAMVVVTTVTTMTVVTS